MTETAKSKIKTLATILTIIVMTSTILGLLLDFFFIPEPQLVYVFTSTRHEPEDLSSMPTDDKLAAWIDKHDASGFTVIAKHTKREDFSIINISIISADTSINPDIKSLDSNLIWLLAAKSDIDTLRMLKVEVDYKMTQSAITYINPEKAPIKVNLEAGDKIRVNLSQIFQGTGTGSEFLMYNYGEHNAKSLDVISNNLTSNYTEARFFFELTCKGVKSNWIFVVNGLDLSESPEIIKNQTLTICTCLRLLLSSIV